jgi:hypothetical protein
MSKRKIDPEKFVRLFNERVRHWLYKAPSDELDFTILDYEFRVRYVGVYEVWYDDEPIATSYDHKEFRELGWFVKNCIVNQELGKIGESSLAPSPAASGPAVAIHGPLPMGPQ